MVDTVESQANKELSPGQILMQARQQAGMTHEQVAQELYMTVSKVKALEVNDFARLNSDTFVRGYIRAYANLFKLNAAEVISVYEQYLRKNQPQAAVNHPAIGSGNSHKGVWQFVAVIVIFFAGLWLISVWFFDNHNETENAPITNISSLPIEKTVTTSVEPVVTNEAVDVAVAQNSVLAKVAVAKSAESNSAPGVTAAASATSTSTVAHSGASNSLPAAAIQNATAASASVNSQAAVVKTDSTQKKNTLDEISFSFRAECWLEVSDSRGDVLATELEAAGSKIKLVGKAPFDVKLGNAPGVDILLNGNKIDVIPLMGSNVLILKVGN